MADAGGQERPFDAGAALRSVAAPTVCYRVVGLPAGRIKIRATMPGYLTEFANHRTTLASATVFTLVDGQTLSQNWADPLVPWGPYLDLVPKPVS